MELHLTATADCVARIRQRVRDKLAERLSDRALDQASLAISEACANVVKHAYKDLPPGPMQLRIDFEGERIRVVIRDRGHPVDPETCRARPLADIRPGGLGTHFMRCAFESVEYEHLEDGWNQLTLIRSNRNR